MKEFERKIVDVSIAESAIKSREVLLNRGAIPQRRGRIKAEFLPHSIRSPNSKIKTTSYLNDEIIFIISNYT